MSLHRCLPYAVGAELLLLLLLLLGVKVNPTPPSEEAP